MVDSLFPEFFGEVNVVVVIGIAAVDDRVA